MNTALVWFRNDLRTRDHEALYTAVQNHEKVISIYCFDPRQYRQLDIGYKKTGKYRAKFLIETLKELKQNLLDIHIPLYIFQKKPEEIIPDLLKEWDADTMYFQKEWTQEERMVENQLRSILPNVNFIDFYQQFLFHPEDIPYESFANIPKVFTEFRKKCEQHAHARPLLKRKAAKEYNYINNTSIPELSDIGYEDNPMDTRTAFPFMGGEDRGLQRIEEYFFQQRHLETYKETRNGLVGCDYSSKLSAWLANGSLSPRQVYFKVKEYEQEIKSNESTYWLIFELIWRDYFKYISLKHGNKIFQLEGIKGKSHSWDHDEHTLKQWIEGNTSEAFVNANMREIAQTGFMSNRGRQNVTSYLAKEMQHDWRKGAAYFESLLIDYDVHSNWGNWMYNSGVGNDPRDRKFNIKEQANRYDPDQEYQNLWLKN